jgi:phage terminase large subunit GpA-like protein
MITLQQQITLNALHELEKYISTWKTDFHIPLISEWAAENRYLPAGTTEYPGLIDHTIAPHLVEIQDCLHPDSGISQVTIMKSTQSLATTAIENSIGHSIRYKLHNILNIISSKNIAGIRSSAAIDVMIDNSGLAEFVKPISTRMKRKIADNKFYKELHGGRRLMMTSWNSIGDAKSLTWSMIIEDELDEAPYELAGQGDPEAIFEGRTKTIRNRKIVKISTPTTTNGRIYKNFLAGDQRYYFCLCPLCGELQILKLYGLGRDYGLRARSETIDSVTQIVPDTVEYICKFCKKSIKEYQKPEMLNGGKWVPTARPVNPEYRSYQFSNLISPVMFYTWLRVMQEFAETDWGENITKFKNFVIDVLGEPWESRTEKKSWEYLKNRAEDYPLYTVPTGGYVITAGCDVQKTWLELVVIAWGPSGSWIIDTQKFHGETNTITRPAWQDMRNYIATKRYPMEENKKIKLPIAMTAIDSAYNPKTPDIESDIMMEHLVYEIVARTPRTIACRGNDNLRDMILKQERVRRAGPLKTRYELAVSELKEELFMKLDLPPTTRGMIHFSKELPDEFFKGVMSEVFSEVKPGKFEWKKTYERNEPLDTINLARGAAERLNLSSWSEPVWAKYKSDLFLER